MRAACVLETKGCSFDLCLKNFYFVFYYYYYSFSIREGRTRRKITLGTPGPPVTPPAVGPRPHLAHGGRRIALIVINYVYMYIYLNARFSIDHYFLRPARRRT